MRYTQAEKMEIIRVVEGSKLPAAYTLAELDVPKSTFYRWYAFYGEYGYDGLADRSSCARRFWNKIPESERQRVVETALDLPELSPRELAWYITDTQGAFVLENLIGELVTRMGGS